jgi:hypothetical protein
MQRIVLVWACSLALGATCAPAEAQGYRPERPYRGLFGGAGENARQILSLSGDAGAGFDDNVLADALGSDAVITQDTARALSGGVGTFSAGLTYSFASESFSFGAAGGTGGRLYTSASRRLVRSTQAAMSMEVRVGPRTSLSGAVSASTQPYLLTDLLPSAGPEAEALVVAELDGALAIDTYQSYSASFGVSQRLTRRARLSASYSANAARSTPQGPFDLRRGGVRFEYDLARGLSLRAGYTLSDGRFAGQATYRSHAIDVGADFARALSVSRRTTLAFSTGSALLQTERGRQFTLIGNARLNHEIGRTWSAWLGYDRQLYFTESWRQPVLANSLGAGLGGLITRRMELETMARAGAGTMVLSQTGSSFDAYTISTTLSYALSRYVQAAVIHSLYRYRFGDQVLLPVGASRTVERQSVRATVSVWRPLLRRGRRDNASG